MVGLAAALYPTAVPPSLTIFDAAAPSRSLWFLFVVSAVLLPVLLAYNAWQYLVFRDKAGDGPQEGKAES